jgi:uncharacterized LabA/DUF88 family protein
MKKRTIIYIDSFNLYYACLKKTAYKWLDIKSLFDKLLDDTHSIVKIKYFTALISDRDGNTQSRLRQKIYINVLRSFIPELEIYYGYYSSHIINAKVFKPPPEFIKVFKTEEKGTDVNLAVHIINDAWRDEFDCAVIVSNDSDLAESLRLVKQEHPNKKIGLAFPLRETHRKPSTSLVRYVDFVKYIHKNILRKSQLPKRIPNSHLYKPEEWDINNEHRSSPP